MATQEMATNHQAKRCPPKKKSWVVLVKRENQSPAPTTSPKYAAITAQSSGCSSTPPLMSRSRRRSRRRGARRKKGSRPPGPPAAAGPQAARGKALPRAMPAGPCPPPSDRPRRTGRTREARGRGSPQAPIRRLSAGRPDTQPYVYLISYPPQGRSSLPRRGCQGQGVGDLRGIAQHRSTLGADPATL